MLGKINKSAEAWYLLRKRLSLSKRELASYIGVNYNTITAWENQASSPDVKYVQKLSADGVNPLFMIGLDDNHLLPGYTANKVRESIRRAAA